MMQEIFEEMGESGIHRSILVVIMFILARPPSQLSSLCCGFFGAF
jgi:hypothetical protein